MTDDPPDPDVARSALQPLVRRPLDDDSAVRLFALAAWSHLAEPGDGIAGRLIEATGPEAALREVLVKARDGAAREAAGLTAKEWSDGIKRWHPRWDAAAVLRSLSTAQRFGIRLLIADDDDWPPGLADLGVHAPLCLWARGEISSLVRSAPRVAIVGARAATQYGEHVAVELAADLVSHGAVIVSGAAYGIDGAAHRAALANGGVTMALLAGGVDRPYPAGNSDLIARIATTGVVASEVPPGSAPTKWRFLQRNRLISALADVVIVVEAGWRSGSLNTAGHAAALARPLGAVPGPVTSAASAGCHRLLREFDARCVTGADDVLELLTECGKFVPTSAQTLFDMPAGAGSGRRTDDVTRISDALSVRSWRFTDDVARRAGMARDDAAAILGLLELEGTAMRGEAGWRRAAAP